MGPAMINASLCHPVSPSLCSRLGNQRCAHFGGRGASVANAGALRASPSVGVDRMGWRACRSETGRGPQRQGHPAAQHGIAALPGDPSAGTGWRLLGQGPFSKVRQLSPLGLGQEAFLAHPQPLLSWGQGLDMPKTGAREEAPGSALLRVCMGCRVEQSLSSCLGGAQWQSVPQPHPGSVLCLQFRPVLSSQP